MKYLVIDTRTGGDWSMDLIFAGLVKAVGPHNVLMYPHKEKHLEWRYSDIDVGDWGKERRTLGFTNLNDLVSSDLTDIKSLAAAGELTVIMDERDETYTEYCRLGLLYIRTPVVIVAGHDRFWNHSPQFIQERFGSSLLRMFLDDWRSEYDELERVSLINLSINFDHYWNRPAKVEKDIDIFFYGYNSHPDRVRYIDHILSHPEWSEMKLDIMLERNSGTIEAFIGKKDYFERMQRAKVCLNIRGGSEAGRAFRFYEIPYVGSFMLSTTPDFRQLDAFEDETHCGFFSNEDELDGWLDTTLMCGNSDTHREKIAARGHEHAMLYHTCEARVRYLLKEIGHG